MRHVRFGSLADMCSAKRRVRFAPKADICSAKNSLATSSRADEGGVSFWVPGFVASLAATPQVPGFSFANILYYSQISAGGNVAYALGDVRYVPIADMCPVSNEPVCVRRILPSAVVRPKD